MEIDSDDEILHKLASGNSMDDYSSWPFILHSILSRIDKIAHNEFPIPNIPPPSIAPPPPEPRFLAPLPSSDPIEPSSTAAETSSQASSQETNKENAAPGTGQLSSDQTEAEASSQNHAQQQQEEQHLLLQQTTELEPGMLPPPIVEMLTEITTTLTGGFGQYPPHTIQRLAELVLSPRQHYRSLVSYLHALDRVVHVTSGSNIYPLPPAIPDISAMSILANGVAGSSNGAGGLRETTITWTDSSMVTAANIGSDEALGGALLTPIPWLQRRTQSDGSDRSSLSPVGGDNNASGTAGPGAVQGGQQVPQQPRQAQQSHQQLEGQVRTESTETIEGPNGRGSIETVSVSVNGIPSMGASAMGDGSLQGLQSRGVTQGELLRQEQRAGVVPVSQLQRNAHGVNTHAGGNNSSRSSTGGAGAAQHGAGESGDAAAAAAAAAADTIGSGRARGEESEGRGEEGPEDETMTEELPHARGPEEIGAADTGPQSAAASPMVAGPAGGMTVDMHGIDVEAAVGRRSDQSDHHHHQTRRQTEENAAEQHALSSSPTPEKREAEDEPEGTASNKKARVEGGEDVGGATEPGRRKNEAPGRQPDAEGDIELTGVIPDQGQASASPRRDGAQGAAGDDTSMKDGD